MYIEESGPSDSPTLLFLHGGGVGGWSWKLQVQRLTDYHCLVPDLPGHGKSLGEGPFNFAKAAEALASVIRNKAHGGKAQVIGLSLGGQLTVELLSRSPELIDHAIISGTLLRPIKMIRTIAPLIRATLKMYAPLQNRDFWIRANMRGYDIPDEFEAEFREDTRSIDPASLTSLLVENMSYRMPPGLERVALPVLVVAGQKETKIIFQSAKDILKAMPNARGFIAAGLGHNWSLEAPDLFTEMVRAWINGCPLPDGLAPFKP
jgi:pimeloyl-ACP methyl ester carboxylesterase